MNKIIHATALAAALSLAPLSIAYAETQANAPADMKMTDAQCTTIWSKASAGATGDLAMDKAKPFVKDFKMADVNADSKLSAAEWKAACAKGWVMSDASAVTKTPGATSDRTPEGATDRKAGSTAAGAPGVDAGKTSAGTSDRTPEKK